MNEKEISEIRRRFNQDKSNITHVRGCYVNEKGEILTRFNQSLGLMAQEESEKFLSILKKTLSGSIGKNLMDITFETKQVVNSPEHSLLMELRESRLDNDEAVETLYEHIISSVTSEGSYLILLAHDTYDVPYRASDGSNNGDDASGVYSYFVCSVCPVKQLKPALSYYVHDNTFHGRPADWVVSSPEMGFTFPAFDDRSANIYSALYYTRDITGAYDDFVQAVFNCTAPMPAAMQKETFEAVLEESLDEDCSVELVQAVHDEIREMVELHKENKEEEPMVVSKGMVRSVLESCGVSRSHVNSFEARYDSEFGEGTMLSPQNIVDIKKAELKTADVTINVNPQRSDLIETRIIDGKKYILVRVEEGVELNGVNVTISGNE